MRVVVLRRDAKRSTKRPGQRKPPPAIEAFFTTDLTLSAQDILNEYGDRWAVEIEIRDANAFDGLGQDQCRKRQRIMGANTFRLVMAAARTLWFIDHVECGTALNLCRYRPWYRQKVAPVNSTWCGPVVRPCMRPEFFPYHGSPQIWPKIMRSQKARKCPGVPKPLPGTVRMRRFQSFHKRHIVRNGRERKHVKGALRPYEIISHGVQVIAQQIALSLILPHINGDTCKRVMMCCIKAGALTKPKVRLVKLKPSYSSCTSAQPDD